MAETEPQPDKGQDQHMQPLKTDEQITAAVTEFFKKETGLEPAEIGVAYPFSCDITVHTEDRTFYLYLTPLGNIKKDTLVEETDEGLVPVKRVRPFGEVPRLDFTAYNGGYYMDRSERFAIEHQPDHADGIFILTFDTAHVGTYDSLVAAIDGAEERASKMVVNLERVEELYPGMDLVGVLSFWAPDGMGWRAVTPEHQGRLTPEGLVEWLAVRYRAKTVQLLLQDRKDSERQIKPDYGIKEIYK